MTVHIRGIDAVIRRVERCRISLPEKIERLMNRLGEIGVETARVRFSEAQYDGINDVSVSAEWVDDDLLVIHADGQAVAFIEFGTGVHYTESHPKAADFGAIRGSYGYGLGRLDSWRYRGEPGTNGEIIAEGKHKGMVKTHGNPPAYAMYDAGREMRNRIAEVAKEVFNDRY